MNLTPTSLSLFAILSAAHFLGDFVLQTATDVANRHRRFVLIRHAATHATLAYVAVGVWDCWPIPVAVLVTHAIIDLIKHRCADTALAFLVDQVLHLVVIAVLAVWLGGMDGTAWQAWSGWLRLGPLYPRAMVIVAGFIATVEGGVYLIAKVVRPYLNELERALGVDDRHPVRPARGFTSAGQVIGRLERALIFLLIGVGQPTGVGFLIAAKSILRFGELKETTDRMESEYVIIGTLASFGYAIALTYGTLRLLRAIE